MFFSVFCAINLNRVDLINIPGNNSTLVAKLLSSRTIIITIMDHIVNVCLGTDIVLFFAFLISFNPQNNPMATITTFLFLFYRKNN